MTTVSNVTLALACHAVALAVWYCMRTDRTQGQEFGLLCISVVGLVAVAAAWASL